jgi:glycosyltransferase involved in cell wall biosynthesis
MIVNKKKSIVVLCANSSWYIYNFRRNTIKAFIKKGYKVVVVAPYDDYSKYFSKMTIKHYKFNLNSSSTNPFKEILVIFKLMYLYSHIRPDFVMNFTPKMNIYSTIASIIPRSKVINNISGLGTAFTKDSILLKFVILLYRFTQIFAAKVFFQNKDDMNMFISQKIIPKKKCEYIPGSGVDLEWFGIAEAPNDGVVRFIIICRMLYEKGIGLYADAAESCRKKYGNKVEFIAIGPFNNNKKNGLQKEVMDDWVAKNIMIYKGAVEDVRPEIARSDCVVLPSVYAEGTPRSLLEGASMGKPIITTNTSGCASTVENGVNGILCRPMSISDLVSSMEKIINITHKDRITMGLKSRELVERKFDEKVVINKYLESVL